MWPGPLQDRRPDRRNGGLRQGGSSAIRCSSTLDPPSAPVNEGWVSRTVGPDGESDGCHTYRRTGERNERDRIEAEAGAPCHVGRSPDRCSGRCEEVLNVTNWAEYIAEDTIANFEKEFGIKVVYDHYDSVESLDSKLLAGNSGYDVVLPLGELDRAPDSGRHPEAAGQDEAAQHEAHDAGDHGATGQQVGSGQQPHRPLHGGARTG